MRFFPTALSASMWLDPDDRRGDEVFLAAYLKQGNIVLDIGANIGTVALASAALVGSSGRVFAFEPHPRIFKYMNANIRMNGCKNIEAFNIALGDRDGTLILSDWYSDDQNRVQLNQTSGKGQKIRVNSLDAVLAGKLKGINHIALLKIDVEGFEIFVLKGAPEILSRSECVYIESYDAHFQKYGYSTNDLLQLLSDGGFNLYKISGSKFDPIILPYISNTCENVVAFRNTGMQLKKRT